MKKVGIIILFIFGAIMLSNAQDKQAPISNVRKISATQGGFTGVLNENDFFSSTEVIGDIDGDGIEDMAVGARGDANNTGAVYILFMNQDRSVRTYQKINESKGGFSNYLYEGDTFGCCIESLGDFDNDGVPDIAVGASRDGGIGTNTGAIYILFLRKNGRVKKQQKISAYRAGLNGLTFGSLFGMSITNLGDFNNDGITDLAVGAPSYDNDIGMDCGSVWILFLNADGTINSQKIIYDSREGFSGILEPDDYFGYCVENIGDIDKDGVIDLAVNASRDDDGERNTGAIYILFLVSDGTVKQTQKVSATDGAFAGSINSNDYFGSSIESLGDIDGDGVNDILTSSYASDDGGLNKGKAWVLNLNIDGTVKDYSEINSMSEAFSGLIDNEDCMGRSVSAFSNLTTSGNKEIIVSTKDDDGAINAGAVYIMELDVVKEKNKQAPISNVRKISATQGGFTGVLNSADQFSLPEAIGDVDGDGIEDLAVGALGTDNKTGAIWILFMNKNRTVRSQQKISSTEGSFFGSLDSEDKFGRDIASIDDFDGDGIPDIAVGAMYDDDGGHNSGAIWLLFLNRDGTVKQHQKISATEGGLQYLTTNRVFGHSLTNIGDLDKDGVMDIAVGSPAYDDDGGLYKGCIWILFLNADGTVKKQQRINESRGGFNGVLNDRDFFGDGIENIGDINNDGVVDIAVHSRSNTNGVTNDGAIYILFLATDGTVINTQKISATEGGFNGLIKTSDGFGLSVVGLGDIDNDGVNDILTGSHSSDDGGFNKGKAWVLYLKDDGTVKDYSEINANSKALFGQLDEGDVFGFSLTKFDDFNASGNIELVIGALSDDDGATAAGAVYIMDLNVKHKPIANAGIDYSICSGEEILLNGGESSVLDNDPLSYFWSCDNYELTDSTKEQLNIIAPLVDEITRYEFVLQVKCDGINADNDTINVIVYPMPLTSSIFQDQNILSISEANSYQWFLNGEKIENATDNTLAVTEDGSYQVQLFNELDCFTKSDNLNVSIVPIAIGDAPKRVCSGSVLTLNGEDSYSPIGGKIEYQWTSTQMEIPDANLLETSFFVPSIDNQLEYEFYLVVSQNGIVSPADTLVVTINPIPEKPTIEQFADTLLASEAIKYIWFLTNEEIENSNNRTLFVEQSAIYTVKVANEYDCVSNPSTELFVAKTNIKGLNYEIKVYPNPVSEIVNVFGLPTDQLIGLKLLNLKGEKIYSVYTNDGEVQFDMNSLPKGYYLVVIENNLKESIKILKE